MRMETHGSRFSQCIEKPLVIPVFIPHMGCLHQCTFCNQRTITGATRNDSISDKMISQIDTFLTYRRAYHSKVQIAFYGGNFLGQPKQRIRRLLNIAQGYIDKGKVTSIRFSTRPDTIDIDRFDLIRPFSVETIELGVQSMDDQVLSLAKRGHSADDTIRAFTCLRSRKYEIGLQMMTGLPGDSAESTLLTGKKIANLSPDFVRIYPTVVLTGSPLADRYAEGKYTPMPLAESVTLVKKLYMIFSEHRIPVIRMGLQATGDLDTHATILAGPYHPAFGHMVHSELFLDRAISLLSKEKPGKEISIIVNPRSISKLRGLKNYNIGVLKEMFCIKNITIRSDARLHPETMQIDSV